VKLKGAITLAGQVKNATGAAMPGAEIEVEFKSGNTYDTFDAGAKPVDAEGRYEIKGLPADGQYLVFASARGYGRSQRNVEPDTETNRMELESFELKPANMMIAGQVLSEQDKPLAGVYVNISGEGQPSGSVTTDGKGRFHFQVCEGRISLFANSPQGGSYAQAAVEAGDTNIVMTLGAQTGVARRAPQHASLQGGMLPDLASVNLAADAAPAGKAVLLCLVDIGQRPSRHILHELDQQAAALEQKNVSVAGVQALAVSDETFNDWKTNSPVTIPVGRVVEMSGKNAWATRVSTLPWLVLADASHKVVAEGFSLDELDAQIQKMAK